jgi:type VI secretion system protein ImpE
VQDPEELLRAGDLASARAAVVARVKAYPGDRNARAFMFQLFATLGLWDKAETALTSFVSVAPDAAAFAAVYSALIRAEKTRSNFYAGSLAPRALVPGDAWFDDMLAALKLEIDGKAEAASAVRDTALEAAPDVIGSVDGNAFEWFVDADARFGPVLEATLNGVHGFVPMDKLRKLEIQPPKDLRDLVWAPARMTLKDGASLPIYIPVRYNGITETSDTKVLLSRETRWAEAPDGTARGEGQRLFVTDNAEYGILDMRLVEFE